MIDERKEFVRILTLIHDLVGDFHEYSSHATPGYRIELLSGSYIDHVGTAMSCYDSSSSVSMYVTTKYSRAVLSVIFSSTYS